MRNAETVLAIIRERGRRKLPLEDVYRQLFNPSLYVRAYGRIYGNKGAMTRGVTKETVDGMSLAKIEKIIAALRYERYRFTPVRRVDIPKKNGKTRPLGIPTWSDKLLQEVIRSLLEAYYEPQFSDHSHGFRPGRGCHTALTQVKRVWSGTAWFVEGDIAGCFDNIDHDILLSLLRKNVHDNRFVRLISSLLKAGYMDNWRRNPTLSGTPQGGIVSPLLANLYLDQLDTFVAETLLPEYSRGGKRKISPAYRALLHREKVLHEQGQHEEARVVKRKRQAMPSIDTTDPNYRRLRYVRYADDFLIGYLGPKAEAEEIKDKVGTFLRETLKLELSADKTKITHATSQAARFLGYDIAITLADEYRCRKTGSRAVNGTVGLRVPAEFIETRCRRYMSNGKPIGQYKLQKDEVASIFAQYQAAYRGYVQYYALARNLFWMERLHWIMRCSLVLTLARKFKVSPAKIVKQYATSVDTRQGKRRCLQVVVSREGKKPLVVTFGGIPLHREEKAVLTDYPQEWSRTGTVELVKRLLADTCEVCGSTHNVEVHHIRKLADVIKSGRRDKPLWARLMAARKRKTLVVCRQCHDDIHAGRPLRLKQRSE